MAGQLFCGESPSFYLVCDPLISLNTLGWDNKNRMTRTWRKNGWSVLSTAQRPLRAGAIEPWLQPRLSSGTSDTRELQENAGMSGCWRVLGIAAVRVVPPGSGILGFPCIPRCLYFSGQSQETRELGLRA